MEALLNSIDVNFNKELRRSSAVIGGSTAMYYLMIKHNLWTSFIPTNIDIFVSLKDIRFIDYLTGLNTVSRPDITSFGVESSRPGSPPYYLHLHFIEGDVNPIDHVWINMNLDICKCTYNGYKLSGPIHLLKKRHCAITRVTTKEEKYIDLIKLYSCIKLNCYGFNVEYDPDGIIREIVKYRKRGFTFNTRNLCFQSPAKSSYSRIFRDMLHQHENLFVYLALLAIWAVVFFNNRKI